MRLADGGSTAARAVGSRAFALLTWGLSFHIVAMVLLLGRGLAVDQVRVAAAWKEMLAIALVAGAALRVMTGRAPGLVIRAPDLLAAGIVSLALIHAGAAGAGIGPDHEVADLALGLRDLVFGFALYAVGRTTPALAEDPRLLRRFFAVGAITSAIAVWEWWAVTPEQLVLLGVASYFNEFLGASMLTRENVYGLPGNYWTMVGGRVVQRAGSVYMSSQGFAMPFLLVIPAATLWITHARRWHRPLVVALYGLLWAGLLLTLARATIAACLAQVVALMILWRRPAPVLVLAAVGAAVAGALLVTVPGLPGFVWETVMWETPSSASHSNDYYNALISLVDRPLGAGIGTADATAARLGLQPITGDNLLLKYGVELGVAALLLLAGWLASVAWTGWRAASTAGSDARRAFASLAAVAAVGVLVNGVTAVVFNSPTIGFLFFWIAGTAVAIAPDAAGDA